MLDIIYRSYMALESPSSTTLQTFFPTSDSLTGRASTASLSVFSRTSGAPDGSMAMGDPMALAGWCISWKIP